MTTPAAAPHLHLGPRPAEPPPEVPPEAFVFEAKDEHHALPPSLDDLTTDVMENLRAWRLAILRGVDIEDLEVLVARLMEADARLEEHEAELGSR